MAYLRISKKLSAMEQSKWRKKLQERFGHGCSRHTERDREGETGKCERQMETERVKNQAQKDEAK